MKLTVLGSSGAYPSQTNGTTSFLLQSEDFSLLIDAGSGSFVQLEKKLDPLKLDAVLLSHYHGDHIADLQVLQYYRQLNRGAETPILPIYGNDEDECHFKLLTIPEVSQGYAYQEGENITIGPFSISFMKTIHPVPCFAFRIEEVKTGKIFVFTGDSGYMERWPEFAKDADLFLADTFFYTGNEKNAFHFTAKETGEIAKAAKVKHVVATHLKEGMDEKRLVTEIENASDFQMVVDVAHPNDSYEI